MKGTEIKVSKEQTEGGTKHAPTGRSHEQRFSDRGGKKEQTEDHERSAETYFQLSEAVLETAAAGTAVHHDILCLFDFFRLF